MKLLRCEVLLTLGRRYAIVTFAELNENSDKVCPIVSVGINV